MRTKLGFGAVPLPALLLWAVVLLMSSPATQARSPERAVILLSCPEGSALQEPLCQAMIQALAQTAAGPHVIRRVARGAEIPGRPMDIGIALHVSQNGEGGLSGHLEWRTEQGGLQRGPTVQTPAKNGTPFHQTLEHFTRSLLNASPTPVTALRTDL